MRFVALVSGGKDSCHAIALANQHGHELVCLANLLPPAGSPDELDSFMYQTAGHQMVGAYAECMGLPLYRRRIVGSAHSHGMQYQKTDGDEVEDLYALLAYVKAMEPGIEAVSSGAIASDYQRLRVEEVCSRLGLVSLAYLWHQPQQQLLRSMIDSGIHAILVKVAALGLDPHKHLGKSLANLEPYLISLADKFGCNVCGEGGEYESLVLDCPLFKRGRIILDERQVVVSGESSADGVGHLDPVSFHVELKQQPEDKDGDGDETDGKGVVHEVPLDWISPPPHPHPHQVVSTAVTSSTVFEIELSMRQGSEFTQISARPTHPSLLSADPQDTSAAIHQAMAEINKRLSSLSPSLDVRSQAVFVHLYLSNMSHFAAANSAYSCHFPSLNPPSRACLQTPLPSGCPIIIDILLASNRPEEKRKVLHVQSISSWAPSCIGPYSQANVYRGLIYMAGQIPLNPATMAVISPLPLIPLSVSQESNKSDSLELARQTRRALESCEAVAVGLRSTFLKGRLGITVYVASDPSSNNNSPEREKQVMQTVYTAFEAGQVSTDNQREMDEINTASILDTYLLPPQISTRETIAPPQIIVITVDSLPRGSLVEIQPLTIDLSYFQTQRLQEEAESSDDEDAHKVDLGFKIEATEQYRSDRCLWSRCSYLSGQVAKLSRYLFHFTGDQIILDCEGGGVLKSKLDEIVKELIGSQPAPQGDGTGIERSMIRAMAWYTPDAGLSISSDPLDSILIPTWVPVRSLMTSECEEGCCILVELLSLHH